MNNLAKLVEDKIKRDRRELDYSKAQIMVSLEDGHVQESIKWLNEAYAKDAVLASDQQFQRELRRQGLI